MKNPFTLSFGRKPSEYIARTTEEESIYETFTEEPVTDQIHVLMGVRGSGKTVAMTSLCERIDALPNWIVIKISPIDDILDALLKILIHNPTIHKLCIQAKLNVSIPGFSLSIGSTKPEQNTVDAIDKILKEAGERNLKILIAIDEVTDTQQMRAFISAFQLFITNNRPIFFLATALFDEIDRLQNVHNLTFLYRAPKSVLTPLSIREIASTYQNIFESTKEESLEMATLTMGYPLAFQILGYVVWANGKQPQLSERILEEFDARIAESAYDKLWAELSDNDKRVMMAIAESESGEVKNIREKTGMDSNYFNQYRRRLRNRGLISVQQYGKIDFALPRFREFLQIQAYFAS